MSSIDERIVKMSFDNSNFEGKVAQTLSTLQKLNDVLGKTGNSANLTQLNKSLKEMQKQLSAMDIDTSAFNKIEKTTSGWEKFKKAVSGTKDAISAMSDKIQSSGAFQAISKGMHSAKNSATEFANSASVIQNKFSAMDAVVQGIFMNIGSRIVDAGAKMTKALTLDPIIDGYNEYSTKMQAIRTILTNTASKGTTYDDVKVALQQLNEYADLTKYNFGQMTQAIGLFTSSGNDLDMSVGIVKGIANLGAASGSTSQQVYSAWYQMSQAFAAGKMSLMDYNSLVSSGMGGEMFQKEALAVAKSMGIVVDESKPFRETLQDGWLTDDVMFKVFENFSKNKTLENAATEIRTVTELIDNMKESVGSGWATSMEYIFGDINQATKLFSSIKKGFDDIIGPSTEARNKMLEFWNQAGGRDDVISGLGNIFQGVAKGIGAVKDGFRDVFPPMTGQKLVEMSKGFKDLTEKFKMSDATAQKIRDTFKGAFSVIDLGKDAVVKLSSAFVPTLMSVFKGVGNVALTLTSSIGKLFSKIGETVKSSGLFDGLANGIKGGLEGVTKFLDNLGASIEKVINGIKNINFQPMVDFFKDIGGTLGKGVGKVFDGLGKAISTINFNTIFSALAVLASKGGLDQITEAFKSVASSIKDFGKTGGKIKEVIDSVRTTLEEFQNNLRAGTLLKLAGAIAMLAASLILLSGINPDELSNGLAGITVLMGELVGAMALLMMIQAKFKDISGIAGFGNMASFATGMIAMAAAIGILTLSIMALKNLNPQELITGLIGIAGAMGVLVAATRLVKTGDLLSTGVAMMGIATALRIMASAVKAFALLSPDNMAQGLFGVAVALAELAAFTHLTMSGDLLSTAAALLVVSAALNVLENAIRAMALMSPEKMLQGLAGVGLALLELAGFANLTSGLDLAATSVGMLVISKALQELAEAVKGFALMSWENMGKGLLGVAAGLTVLGAASYLISGIGLTLAAVGVAAMSVSLELLAHALKSFASMSLQEIGTGILAMAGSLTVLALAMVAMAGGLPGAAAMLVMAAALAVFTPQLMLLSQLSLAQVGIGLLALAGAFTVLGVAGLLLTPVIPAILGLAAAVTLLGVGCVAAGAGVALFATGLTLLAGVVTGSGFLIVELLRQLMGLLPQLGTQLAGFFTNLLTGIATAMPQIVDAMTQVIVGILQAFTNALPQIADAALLLITTLCNVLMEAIPQLIEVGVNLLLALLQGIADNIERVVTVSADIIVGFLEGISSKMGEITQAGIDLAVSFINALADGIENNVDDVTAAIESLLSACLYALGAAINDFFTSGDDLINSFINGLLGKEPDANSAGTEVAGSTKEGLDSEDATDAGDNLVQTFIDAITGKSGDADSAGAEVAGSAKEGMDGEDASSAGSNLVQGFINGMGSLKAKAISKGIEIAKAAADAIKNALKINSPSKVLYEIGRFTAEGFALGIGKNTRMVDNPSKSIANRAVEGMSAAISAASDILSNNVDASPTITPVMDLTNVETGARTISSLMNNPSINASMSGLMSRSIGQIQNRTGNEEVVSALKDLKKDINKMNNTTYQINGITYDDGSNINSAVETLVRAARIERRI